jgi:hypothetical protein
MSNIIHKLHCLGCFQHLKYHVNIKNRVIKNWKDYGGGYIYYVWFPQPQIFKIGITVMGLRRFRNKDYMKFYDEWNEGNKYEYIHTVVRNEYIQMEKKLLSTYVRNGFRKVPRKKEYFFCKSHDEYIESRNIFRGLIHQT